MIIDYTTGRIAYHCIRFRDKPREDGSYGSDFIQFDFEGKEIEQRPYNRYFLPEIDPNNP